MSYIISNPHSRTIWSSKGFRIHPHTAEKTTRFLFRGTFGHTVQCKATHLLLEGDAVPDELLGEDHAVLHVDVPVGHPVHQEQPLDAPRALAAAVAAVDQAARLVPGKVVLGETEVALRVSAR